MLARFKVDKEGVDIEWSVVAFIEGGHFDQGDQLVFLVDVSLLVRSSLDD